MSSGKLTFGPPGSQWIYDKQTKTYDLTRSSSPSSPTLKISTTYGPPSTSVLLAPAKTALVIVDMQNFFLHPSCRSHPAGLAAVAPLAATVRRCREVGVQVVWVNWGLTDADLASMPAGVLRGFESRMLISRPSRPNGEEEEEEEEEEFRLGVDLGGGKGWTLCAGAWNSAIFECLADVVNDQGDVFVDKNRMSGLWSEEQPLWKYLMGKETLLFAGVNTDQCVLGTLTDAYSESCLLFFLIFSFLGSFFFVALEGGGGGDRLPWANELYSSFSLKTPVGTASWLKIAARRRRQAHPRFARIILG